MPRHGSNRYGPQGRRQDHAESSLRVGQHYVCQTQGAHLVGTASSVNTLFGSVMDSPTFAIQQVTKNRSWVAHARL